jgi:hypothetical protein
MPKGTFWEDTFEKAVEAGQSMAKSGGKQIKQTFNPLQMLRNSVKTEAPGEEKDIKSQAERMNKSGGNSTPVDLEKLDKHYGAQDEQKAKALANRLFQMVKSGEEKVIYEQKQKEQQKKQEEIRLAEEKKRQEAERMRRQQEGDAPQGKERKSIFGTGKKKKSAGSPAPTEIKPSKGKQ